jgi:hypothetical protein
MAFGGLFFCINEGWLHVRHEPSLPFALLLVVLGLLILNRPGHGAKNAWSNSGATPVYDPDFLIDSAVIGAVNRKVESPALRGGKLSCVLGAIELDLRRALPADPSVPVILEVSSVMGGIKIRIPDTWRLSIATAPVLSGLEDRTAPITRPDFITGTLVITGSIVLSGVEIEN